MFSFQCLKGHVVRVAANSYQCQCFSFYPTIGKFPSILLPKRGEINLNFPRLEEIRPPFLPISLSLCGVKVEER